MAEMRALMAREAAAAEARMVDQLLILTGGTGGQGIIVIIYTPSSGPPPPSSCTYSGSGDWHIEYADNCYETGTIYVTGACYFDFNGAGSFGLAGTLACTKVYGGAGFEIQGKDSSALLEFHN